MSRGIRKIGSYYLHITSDYYFVSFPKSGRTWIKSFLANYYSSYHKIPLFYNFSPIFRLGKRAQVPRIMFMHPLHRGESKDRQTKYKNKLEGKKLIFLIRDPEKVVFTYYHRLLKRMRDSEVATMSMKQFIRDPSLGISQLVDFMNYWYEMRGTFKGFILIRYEDFVSDPRKEFTRLLEYLEAPVIESALELALSKSVDTTRKIEHEEFVADGSLQSDILKGSEYFESNDSSTTLNDSVCKRYTGDETEYTKIISTADREYMAAEITRLHPELRYS